MKSIIKTGFTLVGSLLIGLLLYPQTGKNSTTNSKKTTMDNSQTVAQNKETVRNIYENIFNNRKFELLDNLVSDDFTGVQGAKGAEGFKQVIAELVKGFPDAQWKVEEIIAEGDKVMARQVFTGTHTGQFRFYTTTGKKFSNGGVAVFEFKNGKIIRAQIDTDRLGFLQQMGLIPMDLKELVKKQAVH